MKLSSNIIKIKRLRWQIEQIRDMIETYKDGNRQFQKSIERRKIAIIYLSRKNANWEEVNRLFGFDYNKFNVNRGLVFSVKRAVINEVKQ